MAVIENAIPILEYDPEPRAVLMPDRDGPYHFSQRAVFPFLGDTVEDFARSPGCAQIGEFETVSGTFLIYRTQHRGVPVCFCRAPLGAPAAAQLLDFLLCGGVRYVIAAGSCGALAELEENAFLIPNEALRDEGTSYHYLPASRTIQLPEMAIEAIRRALREKHLPFCTCKTWTTDGFYRETRGMVARRRAEGCTVVEMECAALAACAQFRGAVFGQLLFTADTLAGDTHDDRDWGRASYDAALEASLDAVTFLGGDAQ